MDFNTDREDSRSTQVNMTIWTRSQTLKKHEELNEDEHGDEQEAQSKRKTHQAVLGI